MFTGLDRTGGLATVVGPEIVDGLDPGQVGLVAAAEVPAGPDDAPAEFKGSDGAAIAPGAAIEELGAGDTDTGGPMITGLELLTAIGPGGGAIVVETGARETHELQVGLAAFLVLLAYNQWQFFQFIFNTVRPFLN